MASTSFQQRVQEYLTRPLEYRLDRLGVTPEELGRAVEGQNDATLSSRPGPKKWSAKEVICHLRDIEELVVMRFQLMLVADDPRVFVAGVAPRDPQKWGIDDQVAYPANPDRWAEDRQYQRNDAFLAMAAFRQRRLEALSLLRRLNPEQWHRACIFPDDRRMTFEEWTAAMAAHDDGHVAQITQALASAPTILPSTNEP
jgi:hypothetical protein